MTDPDINQQGELAVLKRRLEAVERELHRVEELEKSLAYQEIVLTKKVNDLNSFEERLEGFVQHDHLKGMRKAVSQIPKHEDLLFENTQYVKEIMKELQKVKEAHKVAGEHHSQKAEAQRQESEENFARMKRMMLVMERERRRRRKEVLGALQSMKKSYDARLERMERQNAELAAKIKRLGR